MELDECHRCGFFGSVKGCTASRRLRDESTISLSWDSSVWVILTLQEAQEFPVISSCQRVQL